jgi:CheY-like chemotaxis protein
MPFDRTQHGSTVSHALQSDPSLRILIVEDHPESAHSLERLLRMFGHQVRVEYAGLAGISTAEWFRPSAALIDLTLPDLDGFEVGTRLRELPAARDCFLISMTGWATDEHAHRAVRAGFQRHLIKPLSLESLTEALAAAQPRQPPNSIIR